MNFEKIIKGFGGKEPETNKEFINKVFSGKNAITAKSAYMMAKYGEMLTQKTILSKFFEEVHSLIISKSSNKRYCGMIEIDDDIKEFLPLIIRHFRDDLGYKVLVIDNNTCFNANGKMARADINSTFLILIWNNPVVSENLLSDEEIAESISAENLQDCVEINDITDVSTCVMADVPAKVDDEKKLPVVSTAVNG